uniref:Uncharacterized protein n=1 Tax=Anguilla anguilla TaxID=7936 RepID=A0A0E9RQX0_ANGAN
MHFIRQLKNLNVKSISYKNFSPSMS